MNRKEILDEINQYFARFISEIKVNAALSLTDINKYSEYVLIPILSEVYGYQKLKNLNSSSRYNFHAVDLGDDDTRVAVQVTSQTGAPKVIETLEKFKEYKLQERFRHLFFFILGEKVGLTSSKIDALLDGSFEFDKAKDYRDYTDILKEISGFDIDRLSRIRDVLDDNFGNTRIRLTEVETRIGESLDNQLQRLKNSRKYIPGVFVEVSEVKDQARYFVDPMCFYDRIVEDIARLHFRPLNRLLTKLGLDTRNLVVPDELKQPTGLVELATKAKELASILSRIYKELEPYWDAGYRGAAVPGIALELMPVSNVLRNPLATASNSLRRDLEGLLGNLKMVEARVLFLIAKAGQGKTNFVCDLAENVLKKRSLPVVFMTGKELGSIAAEDVGRYVLREAFGESHPIGTMLDRLNKLGARKNCPVTLIIDGINEHTALRGFSQHLERFVEEVVRYPHLRLILTCRQEYFEERFSNFKVASFSYQVVFFESFNERMGSKHKSHMLENYFQSFRLRHSYISPQVEETLQNDTLLLRMFCESYGDPNSVAETDLQQIHDIYRYEVFRRYLETKLHNISQSTDRGGLGVGTKLHLDYALNEVVRLMVEHESFSNLRLFDVDRIFHEALGGLVGEDIILRLDLADEKDPFGKRFEVINFTYDELRDYLVAQYLASLNRTDPEAFEAKLDALVRPDLPVAEGLMKYIFMASKQPAGHSIHDLIVKKPWYEQTFIEGIFSVRDSLVQDEDIQQIRRLFFGTARNTAWIIKSLAVRWDRERYGNLNIDTLFGVLDEMDKPAFDRYVVPAIGHYRSFGYDHNGTWTVDDICEELSEADLGRVPKPLLELLIYFLDIPGGHFTYPAFEILQEYCAKHPSVALDLLRRHTDASNVRIQAQVWRLLAYLSRSLTIPTPIIETARRRLAELGQAEVDDREQDNNMGFLERQIIWFLDRFTLYGDDATTVESSETI